MATLGGPNQTFAVASDECLIELIRSARNQLVVVAPALTTHVATALADRCGDETVSLNVVLDADPEVYRLGYGDQAALETLRVAMTANGLALARQAGIRIGLIVADERMLVYSPVPRLIEAGSENQDKPNAVVISGNAARQVATAAAGGGKSPSEIGLEGLGPDDIRKIETELSNAPPQQFDIARAIRVFSSQAEFVELEIENLRVTVRRVPLPSDLMGIRSEGLISRINSTLSAPPEVNGPFDIEVEQADGTTKAAKVDSRWVNEQRASLEREFTFLVPRHGRVILIRDKERFQAELGRFERNIDRYKAAASAAFGKSRQDFRKALIEEFLPAWEASPPDYVTRYYPHPSKEQVRDRLGERLDGLLEEASSFQPIRCRVLYKGITWASANDPEFTNSLTETMRKRGVPRAELAKLFSEFDAAKGQTGQ
ncbi:hypothetical protein OVA07_04070 [Novosphingobium sp. SL115]|uniref:hypothetical protein n=1 Tax=Novosphingobium sp. SL115 TaxID=2995150 RepID=UPI002274C604|nr:hypothetical protein [Novosphingobium sp. SL115]MCY1670184.1 hypothetical protein [Novosphingobium sp. SL115]